MSAPVPRDIESGDQWQVRWTAPNGSEITRTGTEAQVHFIAGSRPDFGPIIEKRTITVGPWVDPDADQAAEDV